MKTTLDQLFHTLSTQLELLLGERLDRVLLYGSHARGEATPDSDIDILVVMRGEFDYAELIRETSVLVAGLSLEHDVVISRAFVSNEALANAQTPFIANVQREGVAI